MRRYIINLLFFLCAFIAIERFCHKQTHGFRLTKIQSKLIYNADWDTSLSSDCSVEDLHSILSQSFNFLNSGGESYVFISGDGHYILKFFKHHHMRPKNFEDALLPSPLRKKYRASRAKKLDRLFTSCKLSYERLREGTGLIFLHLNKSDELNLKVKIFDPIGCIHKLNIDDYTFALQKKAVMAYPTLLNLVESGEIEAAKLRLDSLLDLIVERCSAGLADHDARKRNFGFIGEKAIELDLGSFSIDDNLKALNAIHKTLLFETIKLRRWIKKYTPELSQHLEEGIKNRLI